MKFLINGVVVGDIFSDVSLTFETNPSVIIPPIPPVIQPPPPIVVPGETITDLGEYNWDDTNGVYKDYPLRAGQLGIIRFNPKGHTSNFVSIGVAEHTGISCIRKIFVSDVYGNIIPGVNNATDTGVQATAYFSVGVPNSIAVQSGYPNFNSDSMLFIHTLSMNTNPDENAEFAMRVWINR